MDDADLPLQKIAINGPTLASMIQRFSSSPGDVDGLLFGHVSLPLPPSLSDDDPSPSPSPSIATVTSHFSSSSPLSFYDPLGRLDHRRISASLAGAAPGVSLLGWFVGRRRTPLRPSMRESSVSLHLSKTLASPCVFVILSSPSSDQAIHTHDYRAFQYRRGRRAFEATEIELVNVGPAFREHYGTFGPESPLPWVPVVAGDGEGDEKGRVRVDVSRRWTGGEQREMDRCAEGFVVERLGGLVGPRAGEYAAELEELYERMLAKLERLARLVEASSARVLDQEERNLKLKKRVAGLE
ncbi:hypothetical protein QJS10_CPB21g01452 [Acorus calamus]|uniref:Uncharacterized protein n=1 Tax=Acorus calamus TaxID=4465 RepID=A0AAV9C3B9_ACOCL|nr:hypothetical protein QJS10_CPB21g01452 [Acorus calamus]